MADFINGTRVRIETAVNEYFLSDVLDRLSAFQRMLQEIRQHMLPDRLDSLEKRTQSNARITQIIRDHYVIPDARTFKEEFTSYFNAINSGLLFLPEQQSIQQSEERYNTQVEDSGVIRFGKWAKRLTRKLRWTSQKALNLIRTNNTNPSNLGQRVPLRSVGTYFFQYRLARLLTLIHSDTENRLLGLIDNLQNLISSISYASSNPLADQLTHSISDLDHLLAGFDRLKSDLKKDVSNSLNQVTHLATVAMEKAGTFELNPSFFDPKINEQRFAQIDESFRKFHKRIVLNHRVVKENWVLNHELDQFYDELKLSSKKTCERLNDKVHNKLFKFLNEIEDSLDKSKNAFDEKVNDRSELMDLLAVERTKVNGQFKRMLVPNSVRMMLFQNLPSVTLGLQRDFEKAKTSVNTATSVKKNFVSSERLRPSEISVINPRKIIEYEYFEGLVNARKELQSELVGTNSRIQPALIEISNIHSYTFESAIKSLETPDVPLKDVYEAIYHGFERTYAKLNELKEQMVEITQKATDELDKALDQLGKDLQHLKVVDRALETNIRILDRKARSRTKGYINNLKSFFVSIYQKVKRFLVRTFFKTVELYQTTEKNLTTESHALDDSVTLFLNNASTSINNLPFIYRLLFRQDPLDDFNFFIGRKKELKILNKAIESWREGDFSSVLLSGPRGSGLTSLFNYFEVQVLDEELLVNRIQPKQNISDREELLTLLKSVFNQEKFQSIDDIATYLNECGIQRIILVDELQRFFLRRINGFEVLHDIQKLIRLTQKNVFWVVTISKLSINYLNKTIQLSEFFTWNIELSNFDQSSLDQLIKKRHEVSGFNLRYDHEIAGSSKKFKKLPEKQKQIYLADTFLTQLHKTAEGSLSLALMAWVLALEGIDKKTLRVRSIPSVRDVLRAVGNEKLSILHVLLLHHGLNFHELSEVVNMDPATLKSHLATMEKSRMISSEKGLINVNTLLYWSAISTLRNKNILH